MIFIPRSPNMIITIDMNCIGLSLGITIYFNSITKNYLCSRRFIVVRLDVPVFVYFKALRIFALPAR